MIFKVRLVSKSHLYYASILTKYLANQLTSLTWKQFKVIVYEKKDYVNYVSFRQHGKLKVVFY